MRQEWVNCPLQTCSAQMVPDNFDTQMVASELFERREAQSGPQLSPPSIPLPQPTDLTETNDNAMHTIWGQM